MFLQQMPGWCQQGNHIFYGTAALYDRVIVNHWDDGSDAPAAMRKRRAEFNRLGMLFLRRPRSKKKKDSSEKSIDMG